MTGTVVSLWVVSDVSPDGTYVLTIQTGDDIAVTLDRARALAYATTVMDAAARADYDAAVIAQLVARGISIKGAAELVADMRDDRPPLDPAVTEPFHFNPIVTAASREPAILLTLHGETVGQISTADAKGHAAHVLEVLAGVDLDAAYVGGRVAPAVEWLIGELARRAPEGWESVAALQQAYDALLSVVETLEAERDAMRAALRRLAVADEMAGMGDVTDPEGLARIDELHTECQVDATRWNGTRKKAATCKWCDAKCECVCHKRAAGARAVAAETCTHDGEAPAGTVDLMAALQDLPGGVVTDNEDVAGKDQVTDMHGSAWHFPATEEDALALELIIQELEQARAGRDHTPYERRLLRAARRHEAPPC